MYYLGIVYYLIQDGLGPRYWLGNQTHISVLNILSNITFLHGFNPYWITSIVPGGWSIGVEMTFYAVVPFLFSRIKNINHAFWFFIISLFVRLFLEIMLMKFPLISLDRLWSEYLFFYFPSQLPFFALGIMMYYFISDDAKIYQLSGKSLIVFSLILVVKLITGKDMILPYHVFFGFAFLIFSIGLSRYKFKLVVNPIIKYIGKISFSMYLVHFAVLHWLTELNFINYTDNIILNYFVRFLLVVMLTAILASLFYNLIEIPSQKLGKKIIGKMERKYENPLSPSTLLVK